MTRREERIEAMSKLPNEEVLHRICDYPDPDLLNKNARFPVEQIARERLEDGGKISLKQRNALILQFVNHTNAQVIAREAQFEHATHREVIDTVLAFPDQDRLNYHMDGTKKEIPLGEMAEHLREKNYRATWKQMKYLVSSFAEQTAVDTDRTVEQKAEYEAGQDVFRPAETSQAVWWFATNASIDSPEKMEEINNALKEKLPKEELISQANERWEHRDMSLTDVSVRFTHDHQGEITLTGTGDLRGRDPFVESFVNFEVKDAMEGILDDYIDDGMTFEDEERTGIRPPLFWGFDYERGTDLSLRLDDLDALKPNENMEL